MSTLLLTVYCTEYSTSFVLCYILIHYSCGISEERVKSIGINPWQNKLKRKLCIFGDVLYNGLAVADHKQISWILQFRLHPLTIFQLLRLVEISINHYLWKTAIENKNRCHYTSIPYISCSATSAYGSSICQQCVAFMSNHILVNSK